MMSLALTPGARRAVDPDLVGLRVALEERLGGEDHLDLARPDAERQGPERAVRARVRVAAHDGHAGLGQAEFRADDVDDALAGRSDAVERDPELGAVRFELADLGGGHAGRAIGRLRGVVGMEWSAVATVWPGRRTPMPRARRPENACGLVTSCTRWRSTARTAGAPGSWVTT